jgi:WD40 repeat protein
MWISALAVLNEFIVSASPKKFDQQNRKLVGGEMMIWNWQERKLLSKIEEDCHVSSLIALPSKNMFLAGSNDGSIRAWSLLS